jgi:hypothetical protein
MELSFCLLESSSKKQITNYTGTATKSVITVKNFADS